MVEPVGAAAAARAADRLEAGADEPPVPPAPAREGLATIARDLWAHRELVHQLTLRDIRIRYKQAVMGFGWAVFMPILIVLAGCLVRFAMAQVSGATLSRADLAAMAVKAVPWAFFVGAIGFATPSLVNNINLVTKIYFPREVLPLSSVLAQCFDSMIGAAAVLVALPLLGVTPNLQWVWIPLLVLLLVVFTTGVALFLSCANLFFRDVKYIVQIVLTFGIFFTPVLFEPAAVGAMGARILMLNPVAPILEGLRLAVVDGHSLAQPLLTTTVRGVELLAWTPWHLAYSAAWAFGGLVLSALLFRRSAALFAEYV